MLVINNTVYNNLSDFREVTGVKMVTIKKSQNENEMNYVELDENDLVEFYTDAATEYRIKQDEHIRLASMGHDLTADNWISHDGEEKLISEMATRYIYNAINVLIRENEEEDLRNSNLFQRLAIEYVQRTDL